jgi:hypothetical protein
MTRSPRVVVITVAPQLLLALIDFFGDAVAQRLLARL